MGDVASGVVCLWLKPSQTLLPRCPMPSQVARRATRKAKAQLATSPCLNGRAPDEKSSQAGRSVASSDPPRYARMFLPLAETLEYNERPGGERAIIQAIAHMMAINEGAPEIADQLIPAANHAYRRSKEGSAVAQRLVDMAKDILPELALRLTKAPILENIKEATSDAKVSVSFAEATESRLCSKLAKKMEAANERAMVEKACKRC